MAYIYSFIQAERYSSAIQGWTSTFSTRYTAGNSLSYRAVPCRGRADLHRAICCLRGGSSACVHARRAECTGRQPSPIARNDVVRIECLFTPEGLATCERGSKTFVVMAN
jgi:hypothetical protein